MPCSIQLPGCEGLAVRMDHIVPAAEGGSNDPSNLRPACDFCNSSLGGKTGSLGRDSGGAASVRDGGTDASTPPGTRLK